uniref:Uncharacterized protein n=1 Tax=Rhizophora mucronata TaxID=61149 RepID=A0A2P2J6W3_RHIMU
MIYPTEKQQQKLKRLITSIPRKKHNKGYLQSLNKLVTKLVPQIFQDPPIRAQTSNTSRKSQS